MASMNIAKGLASVFTKSTSVSWPQLAAGGWYRNLVKIGTIPTGLIILLVFALICGIVMGKTKVGRYILCLGSNRKQLDFQELMLRSTVCWHT
jgi:Ribose/xylose/arabinose/galactoside ABC-type transport systems, permease components